MADFGRSSMGGKDNSESDFKSRFQRSLQTQQEIEQTRLAQLRQDHKPSLVNNLKDIWSDALQASKMSEQDKLDVTKKNTISPFLVTDGSGLVRDRIEGFEKLFMQSGSTVEQFNATVAAGYSGIATGALSGKDDLEDVFELGSTKLYRIEQLISKERVLLLRTYIQENGKNLCALPCGVYGDEKTYTRLLDITAVAIVSNTDPNDIYLALTISLAVGQHEAYTEAYGRKKVVVAMKEGEESPLLEKVFHIAPRHRITSSSGKVTSPGKGGSPRINNMNSSPNPNPVNVNLSEAVLAEMVPLDVTEHDAASSSSSSSSLAFVESPSSTWQNSPGISGKPPLPIPTITTTDNAAIAAAASVYVGTGPGLPSSSSYHQSSHPSSSSSLASSNASQSTTIVVEGRKLTTRRHRDFVARQRHDSESTTTSEPTEDPGEAPFGWEEAMCAATEIYMTEVPEGHEIKMTISPFMLPRGNGAVAEDIYIKRAGNKGGSGDGFGSRYDTLALHYDATLLAGCYQLDATHTAELLEVASGRTPSNEPPEPFEIGSTRSFVRSHLQPKARQALLTTIKASEGRPRMLTSGVYGNPRGPRPPIDLTAVAIYSSQGELFVSLAIHPTPGNETNPDVLGVRRVVVFTSDGGLPVMERIFNVVAKQGTEHMYVHESIFTDSDDGDLETPLTTSESTDNSPALKPNPRKPPVKVALQPPVSPSAPSSSSSYIPQPYEMLIWMPGQSTEILEDTAAAGIQQLRSISDAIRDPWAYTPKDYEDFEEGSTRLFRLRSIVSDDRSVNIIEHMIQTNGGAGAGAELVGGMFIMKDAPYAALEIASVALMEEATNEIYIALTIKGTNKGTGSFTEKGVYGGKRVLITSRAGDPPILEKVFNIIRRKDGSSGSSTPIPPPGGFPTSTASVPMTVQSRPSSQSQPSSQPPPYPVSGYTTFFQIPSGGGGNYQYPANGGGRGMHNSSGTISPRGGPSMGQPQPSQPPQPQRSLQQSQSQPPPQQRSPGGTGRTTGGKQYSPSTQTTQAHGLLRQMFPEKMQQSPQPPGGRKR